MPKVTFISDNKTVDAQDGELLREVCQKNDLSIPFGCENGNCGTCLISIKEGAESLSPKNPQETETLETILAYDDQRLACQCHISNNDVTFDLD
jgi:ferredoxin